MRLFMPSKTTSRPNIKQMLEQAIILLKSKKIASAYLDAELVLAYVLKQSRAFVLAHPERTLTSRQLQTYRSLIRKRSRHYPLAYILGHKEFYGLDFFVSPAVLIPRPESELLVDEAWAELKARTAHSLVIDVGTGSGCLLITTLKKLSQTSSVTGIGLDISPLALRVAKKNAYKHQMKNITFLHSYLLSSLLKQPSLYTNYSHIIILANLPYLTTREISQEPSISKEPRLALDGGRQGLELYKKLAKEVEELAISSQASITILCEINPHQQKGLEKIWPGQVTFKKDLGGKVRLGVVKI